MKLAAWECSPGGPSSAHGFCLTQSPATLPITEINAINWQVHQSQYATTDGSVVEKKQALLKQNKYIKAKRLPNL